MSIKWLQPTQKPTTQNEKKNDLVDKIALGDNFQTKYGRVII